MLVFGGYYGEIRARATRFSTLINRNKKIKEMTYFRNRMFKLFCLFSVLFLGLVLIIYYYFYWSYRIISI